MPVENQLVPPRAYRGEKRTPVGFPQAKLLYLLKLTGSHFILGLGIVFLTGTGSWRLFCALYWLPISVFGKAPQHLLFALSRIRRPSSLITFKTLAMVAHLSSMFFRNSRVVIPWRLTLPPERVRGPFQCGIPVGSELRY